MTEGNNIAVAVNKNEKMWAGHFGIAPYYYVYDKNKNLLEKRVNPHASSHSHHSHDDDNQPKMIKEILQDCNVFIGKRMGEQNKQKLAEKLGVTTILTKETDPLKALEEYLK
jgi:predicted Fe-Mo cluster-binding NifX family protein